jgi:chemotaxis methyl-accepting protein methylase
MYMPRDIELSPLHHDADYATSILPITTRLYRDNSHIPESLDFAATSWAEHGGYEPFNVHIVASSYGLEADTAVSHVTKNLPEIGRMMLTGFDPRFEAIETAQRGFYIYRTEYPQHYRLMTEALEKYGFNVGRKPPADCARVDGLFVNGLAMRKRHDVAFVNMDYLNARGQFGRPDLILCNNLLYHLKTKERDVLLDHMAGQMKDGAVLSIEADTSKDDYGRWRRAIVPRLAAMSIFAKDNETPRPYLFKKIAA